MCDMTVCTLVLSRQAFAWRVSKLPMHAEIVAGGPDKDALAAVALYKLHCRTNTSAWADLT